MNWNSFLVGFSCAFLYVGTATAVVGWGPPPGAMWLQGGGLLAIAAVWWYVKGRN